MRVVILENAEQVGQRAADLFCQLVCRKPNCVLGLATGSTPLSTYTELIARHQAGLVHFRGATTFNLDEYVGMPPEHPQSYAAFMREHLFSKTDFLSERCHLPSGDSTDLQAACEQYEQAILASGGIDLQILGLGSDGHIAFNEPGSSLASRTRIKALTERTRQDNARFFPSIDHVPRLAITMGIGTILNAGKIVLLATGSNKAAAIAATVEGPITSQVPGSALQLHANVTVLLDPQAAEQLSRIEYYQEVEKVQRQLESA